MWRRPATGRSPPYPNPSPHFLQPLPSSPTGAQAVVLKMPSARRGRGTGGGAVCTPLSVRPLRGGWCFQRGNFVLSLWGNPPPLVHPPPRTKTNPPRLVCHHSSANDRVGLDQRCPENWVGHPREHAPHPPPSPHTPFRYHPPMNTSSGVGEWLHRGCRRTEPGSIGDRRRDFFGGGAGEREGGGRQTHWQTTVRFYFKLSRTARPLPVMPP